MRIAVDAMGGDHAPGQIVQGALDGLALLTPEDHLTLVGRESALRELLGNALDRHPNLSIEPATDVIAMHDSPVEAVRHKRDSSLVKMIKMGANDRADVLISAGNTGALVAAGVLMLKPLPGVERPGIAVTIPTPKGAVMMCDAGANVQPKPGHLHKYAIMTRLYMQAIHGIQNPRVGLLNVGTEEEKGTPLIKETAALLKADAGLNYIGYVEGRSLFADACDVLVADGFSGNVALKIIEGMTICLMKSLEHECLGLPEDVKQAMRPALRRVADRYDHEEYGGALLLGLSGLVLKVHGAGGARAIKNAIRAAKASGSVAVNAEIARRMAACAV